MPERSRGSRPVEPWVAKYNSVPATSASAERLFSLAGRAVDDLRQSMKEEMLEILMWARINKEKRQRY